jgi:hypothetical protein
MERGFVVPLLCFKGAPTGQYPVGEDSEFHPHRNLRT